MINFLLDENIFNGEKLNICDKAPSSKKKKKKPYK